MGDRPLLIQLCCVHRRASLSLTLISLYESHNFVQVEGYQSHPVTLIQYVPVGPFNVRKHTSFLVFYFVSSLTVKDITSFCISSATDGAVGRMDALAFSHTSVSLSYTSVDALICVISISWLGLDSFDCFENDLSASSVQWKLTR